MGQIRPGPDLGGLGTSLSCGAQSPHPALVGGRARGSWGVAPPSLPPSSGTRRHLHTFRLARCSPFRLPRFQLLIWKRKKKPAGRGRPQGGNPSRRSARAPPARGAWCRRRSAPPRDGPESRPPPRPAPSLPRPFQYAPPSAETAGPAPQTPERLGSAPSLERKGPLRGKWAEAVPREESPKSPPPQEPLLLPKSPAWCQPPLCPEVNPALSATPQRVVWDRFLPPNPGTRDYWPH